MKTQWPSLTYREAQATYDTLHMWTQILGKIKLSQLPWKNHSWHVTLQLTPTGLTTSLLPFQKGHLQLDLDFVEHQLKLSTGAGENRSFALENLSVAGFYQKLFALLKELEIHIRIWKRPVEVEKPILFPEDEFHSTYNRNHAEALQNAMLLMSKVFNEYRCDFKGKSSELQFFWGSFDLALSRFSGRRAPKHPGGFPNLADWVAVEAYSHEVMSVGFWPGSAAMPEAAFYAYLYPEPEGFKDAEIAPAEAYYHPDLREFALPYKAVQQSNKPEEKLREFLDSSYRAGAELAKWDRKALH